MKSTLKKRILSVIAAFSIAIVSIMSPMVVFGDDGMEADSQITQEEKALPEESLCAQNETEPDASSDAPSFPKQPILYYTSKAMKIHV